MPRRLIAPLAAAALLIGLPGGVLAAQPAGSTATRAFASLERVTEADELGFARPGGLAWSAADRRLHVFDAGRPGRGIAISTAGAVAGTLNGDGAAGTFRGTLAGRIRTFTAASLRGLAVHPTTGHGFVYDQRAVSLLEVDAAGRTVARRDVTDYGLDDVRAIAIAPTADSTDAPGRLSAYLADAGRIVDGAVIGGGIYEVALSAPPRATQAIRAAATDGVSLVRTIDIGAGSTSFTPHSPDPSGLAWVSPIDRLVIVDGEVEESTGAGWHAVNGWFATRAGTSISTFNTTTLTPANKEPIGAAYDPSCNELYVVKDGSNSTVWVYDVATMAVLAISASPGRRTTTSTPRALASATVSCTWSMRSTTTWSRSQRGRTASQGPAATTWSALST